MSAVISRPFVEQHALNRQVWERLVNDPTLAEAIEKVESDRDGNLIMSPPPGMPHRLRQDHINQLLKRHLSEGGSLVEGSVSTPEGVKAPDVVWYRPERARAVEAGDAILPEHAPDLCVEVLSPSNSARHLRTKMKAYFGVGVREVWVCDRQGKMSFYGPQGPLQRSAICPAFPDYIPATFLQ